MDKTLQQKLFDKYPKLFANLIERKEGIWCRDGWYHLLDDLCNYLTYLANSEYNTLAEHYAQVKFTQIKEKFAGLRIYYEGGNEQVRDTVGTLLSFLEHISLEVCEQCGSRERMGMTTKGWHQAVCKACADKDPRCKEDNWIEYDTNPKSAYS